MANQSNNNDTDSSDQCTVCDAPTTPGLCGAKVEACPKCKGLLCKGCSGKYPLLVFDRKNPEESNDMSKNKQVQTFCKSCFQELSTIDFDKTSSVVEPDEKKEANGITLLFAHGAGASRELFRGHAEMLAEKGYRSILFDFPGHASLVEKELTLESCSATVKSILDEYDLKAGSKTVYIGGSLGAYVGFHVLKDLKSYFTAAVLLDCGQNVGPGASMQATMGLWFLKNLTSMMTNKSIVGMMLGVSEKSPADYRFVETTFGAGMFFEQGVRHVECLKQVSPAELIPELDELPILFMNGSEDYRDSEDKWLELCKDKRSYLEVYPGGDHFFTHDKRFLDDIISRIDEFAKSTSD